MRSPAWSRLVLLSPIAALVAGCGGGGSNDGSRALQGVNAEDAGGGAGDGGSGVANDPIGSLVEDGGPGGGAVSDSQIACTQSCPAGLVCNQGVCVPPQASCTTNSDCNDDTYCANGACQPYGTGGMSSDPSCTVPVPPGAFAPTVFCDFKPTATDPFAAYTDVQSTPIVVNFNPKTGDAGAPGAASMIAAFTVPVAGSYTENLGILRILSGADCSQEAAIGGGSILQSYVRSSSTVAVGDLDGDGVAEIVAYTGGLSVVALTRKAGVWSTLWPTSAANPDGLATSGASIFVTAKSPSGTEWGGPSIHDLDNDGKPEIVVEGNVIDGQTGALRAPAPADYAGYNVGIPAVIANLAGVKGGANASMTDGAHLWNFDPAANAWDDDATYAAGTSSPGWAAIGDFNPYDGKKQPEIVVATNNTISIYGLDHSVFLGVGLVPVPGSGGGPPTIADYDGDGLPEVGLAARDFYTVFDPDCQGTPRPGGKCGTAGTDACDTSVPCTSASGSATTCLGPATTCPNYVLWSRKTQDHSSDVTGSSVFDFQATGKAQVVYADECFARVFSGSDGAVQFSQYHSSCTWLENPVVADVDGDSHAELVVMSNTACGAVGVGMDCSGSLDANGVDSTFVGEQCQEDGDCVSGVCDAGYCRCTTTASCCAAGTDAACIEQGLECEPPPAGTPGTGDTCRAPHPHGLQGIRVFKDAKNRWAASRQIWNQHAYSVTNVGDYGSVPQTSAWEENWTTPGLNDYRQNVPGTLNQNPMPDLTAQAGTFACTGGSALLADSVCNRGASSAPAGVVVGFYAGTTKVCSTTTSTPLAAGECETVSCTWGSPPLGGAPASITVVANDGDAVPVCYANDQGVIDDVYCQTAK